MAEPVVTVIGGGLAGCEAAWQAAELGLEVSLYEMRPATPTPAHRTGLLAELVCSNSLKSEALADASGLLKAEMRGLGSVILAVAEGHRVPAGSALAVDREAFAADVTARIEGHPRIRVVRAEVRDLPAERPLVVATGPLTRDALAASLSRLFAQFLGSCPAPLFLSFYDAISPIVAADSVDRGVAFAAARYGKGGADYLNCPLSPTEYDAFVDALLTADGYPMHPFEELRYFEACLPIEELARRGRDALRFGPMRPVGLADPRTGRRPHAVVQLRWENREATMLNLVGFQTRMRRGEQGRVLRMIPGLEKAEFLRYGSIHRNTFIASPLLIEPTLRFRGDPGIFVAGQLVGVEGYLESAATGILAGLNAARLALGLAPRPLPETTLLGALLRYVVQAEPSHFQPMNVHFGLLPPLPEPVRDRQERQRRLGCRALADLGSWRRVSP